MMLEPSWSFDKALLEISAVHRPGGYFGGIQRNRLVEAWGQLVGRTRALREFDQAVRKHGSLTALGRMHRITIDTLRSLRSFYESLPAEQGGGRLAPGDVLGSWHLVGRLGSGGNADVWRVRSPQRDAAAIKVLRRTRGKALERFRAEIALLRQLEGVPGVLPLLDCHCPDAVGAHERVWLVMPLATPILDATANSSPREILAGVAEVAATMAKLHEQQVSHRDLKPENLYRWRGRWVVSDFGIASFPGKASLTTGSNKLGPVHFIAPEMLQDPEAADGTSADVYSLAKTLWVLLCGQMYPPPGEQRKDVAAVQLEQWVDVDGISNLNETLEGCTRYSPADRWSMSAMSQALNNWLQQPR